ncbi:hypothetical protein E4U30_006691 [Claviceps sp. LM220 group G6]|nr:hypothetical protein E4U15_002818 [Claviceps sp. LM218 group G6]KAG6099419.1 hypothetical protein E4U30_006691 [Claviceps sp. LM220 group G6]KAG6101661.1 hypothetical protein E4U31_003606 [Claviceps sp. LM219 group G6]
MLPAALVSTYRQYKEDTNAIAAWLASTAKAFGFPADLLSPPPSAPQASSTAAPKGRLKGKARKQAKEQASASTAGLPAESKLPTHIIRIKDFVPLAEHIASKAVAVPRELCKTIQRVIHARSGFGSKLEDHGETVPNLSAETHMHFVGVLEEVRQVLTPLMPTENSEESPSELRELRNRFAGLAVYEPSSKFLNAPDFERPKKTQNDTVRYESEVMNSLEDAFFALTALVNDMNQVKAHIRYIWASYDTGNFDLTAVAVATNTAIDLVRNLMEDVEPLLEAHGGLGKMLMQLHAMHCMMEGMSPEEVLSSTARRSDDDGPSSFVYKTYDQAEVTYIAAYQMIDSFAAVLVPGQVPLYKEGMYGYFDPKSDHSQKTGRQKFEDNRALLMPFFTELMTVVGLKDWLVQDEFMRGMEEVQKTKKVPFYAVFAAQIFLDITYQLGPNIEKPFTEMMAHLRFIEIDIMEHFKFHANLKIDHWPASNDELLRQLRAHIRYIDNDPVRAIQKKLLRNLRADIPEIASHRLFRMSPLISGLTLFHFRARYHDVGHALANAWGSIQYCQHLYAALEHFVPGMAKWPDMDLVYTNLGPDSFFVGGERPKKLVDHYLKFCLQIGTSAATMTARRRKNVSLFSKAGPRGLKEGTSAVQTMFAPRYADLNGQLALTAEHVSRIIDLSLFEEMETDGECSWSLGQIEDPEKLKEKKRMWQEQQQAHGSHKGSLRDSRNESRKGEKDGGCMTYAQLIEKLTLFFNAETIEFTFPYMHMHRECWKMLHVVRKACDPILRQIFTPAYMQRETELPFVVGWILMAASGYDGVADLRPMLTAAKALNEALAKGAGDVIRKEMGEKLGMPVMDMPVDSESDDDDDKEQEKKEKKKEVKGRGNFIYPPSASFHYH